MRARARWSFVVVFAAALVMALAAPAQAHMLHKPKHATTAKLHRYHLHSYHHAVSTLRWYAKHPARTTRSPLPSTRSYSRASIKGHRWLKRVMKRKLDAWNLRHPVPFVTPLPHKRLWLCIHSGYRDGRKVSVGEASWIDPNAPYYGGMQMDLSFQRAHAPAWLRAKGTADHWTPFQQMWVSEIAVFWHGASITGSWPTTGPPCL